MMRVKIQKYMPVFFNYTNDCKINALFDCFMRHLVFYQLAIKGNLLFRVHGSSYVLISAYHLVQCAFSASQQRIPL